MNMKKFFLINLLGVSLAAPAMAATPTLEELYKIIQRQQAEIDALKNQNKVVEERLDYTAEVAEKAAESPAQSLLAKTSLGGYAEAHYNNFKDNDGRDDEVDLHRFVIFMGHEFSDTVRLFTELEVEHSVAGDGENGEVEVEQAYVEWDYTKGHRAKFGQYLIPVGILNETHEPDTFYGVERNNVERNIIPATWWEDGAMLSGEIAPGLSYDGGAHSGFFIDTAGGDFKVRDGRQKGSEAVANDGAYTARLKYTGLAGLELATTLQYQSDVQQGKGTENSAATLWEAHVIYGMDGFNLRALYAAWDIDGSDFEAAGYDEQTGWYVEPSYRINDKLGVFTRYSEWDNQAGVNLDTEVEQIDVGMNYWLHPRVVLKADWSDYRNSPNDAFNLGVGWSF